ncbi:hypothetical protein ACFLZI_01425 [Nitrospirota bacterium]
MKHFPISACLLIFENTDVTELATDGFGVGEAITGFGAIGPKN